MFDVGFSELMVIALVALVVIGPERLPKVARTVGHLLGRLQRYVSDVKADVNREMQLDEFRKMQEEVERSARALESSVKNEISMAETSIHNSIAPPENQAASPVAPVEAKHLPEAGESAHSK